MPRLLRRYPCRRSFDLDGSRDRPGVSYRHGQRVALIATTLLIAVSLAAVIATRPTPGRSGYRWGPVAQLTAAASLLVGLAALVSFAQGIALIALLGTSALAIGVFR